MLEWAFRFSTEMTEKAKKIDVYSYSMVVFEIMMGIHCWDKILPPDFAQKVMGGMRPHIPESVLNFCGEDRIEARQITAIIDLMKECWANDPEARPSFSQILERLNELSYY